MIIKFYVGHGDGIIRYTNIIQILYKYYTNIIQILYKYYFFNKYLNNLLIK
jgi:hypothetical protein